MDNSTQPWLVRHEFLVRRLHSLSGLIPVGAYMVVHLLVNASVVESPATFQNNVYQIHRLGALLPLVEWTFIFIPILFHAIFGVVIVAGGLPNTGQYPYAANVRYTLQRVTGLIAFVFVMLHVFHMHGWFHAEIWLDNVVRPLGGGQFRPFNAASTAGAALQSYVMVAFYGIGVSACVFHLANGIWTLGITWGVWISQRAQARMLVVCALFGLLLAVVGLSGLFGMRAAIQGDGLEKVMDRENQIYLKKVEIGAIEDNETNQHKQSQQDN